MAAATTTARVLVGTSATTLTSGATASARDLIEIENEGTTPIFVGGPTVTSATGLPVHPGEKFRIDESVSIGVGRTLYGITAQGSNYVRVLESTKS